MHHALWEHVVRKASKEITFMIASEISCIFWPLCVFLRFGPGYLYNATTVMFMVWKTMKVADKMVLMQSEKYKIVLLIYLIVWQYLV